MRTSMGRATWVALFVAAAFLVSQAHAGILDGLDDVKNLKLGKVAQTINVDKDELADNIKTQWGKFKFSDNQVKKIKKIKKGKYKTFDVKAGGDDIKVVVTYLGSKKYQLGLTKLP